MNPSYRLPHTAPERQNNQFIILEVHSSPSFGTPSSTDPDVYQTPNPSSFPNRVITTTGHPQTSTANRARSHKMSTPGAPLERKPLTSFLKLQGSPRPQDSARLQDIPSKKTALKGSTAPIGNDKKIATVANISKVEPNFHAGALRLSEEEALKA